MDKRTGERLQLHQEAAHDRASLQDSGSTVNLDSTPEPQPGPSGEPPAKKPRKSAKEPRQRAAPAATSFALQGHTSTPLAQPASTTTTDLNTSASITAPPGELIITVVAPSSTADTLSNDQSSRMDDSGIAPSTSSTKSTSSGCVAHFTTADDAVYTIGHLVRRLCSTIPPSRYHLRLLRPASLTQPQVMPSRGNSTSCRSLTTCPR
ncbi:hypothetical protein QAD02_020713 [Eretmocerus hayati]|uniref:Uncharacterized protein n=1 Tax=Eretmocerus hayati TaxID=131215 RepID=A0ACC2PNB2_9HYME|nr:hypothetical protein QAD02_020713 [Eretmocerus hayati]